MKDREILVRQGKTKGLASVSGDLDRPILHRPRGMNIITVTRNNVSMDTDTDVYMALC